MSESRSAAIRKFLIPILLFVAILMIIWNVFIIKKNRKIRYYRSLPSIEKRSQYFQKLYGPITTVNEDSKISDALNSNGKIYLQKDITIQYDGRDTNKIFYGVTDLDVDGMGCIYAALYNSTCIKKFDPLGNYVRTIGKNGKGPGEFLGPLILSVVGDSLYVFDWGNMRIGIFDTSGTYCSAVRLSQSIPVPPQDFTYDYRKNIFSLSFYDQKTKKVIHDFDRNGKYIHSFGDAIPAKGTISYLDFELTRRNSCGELFIWKDRLYYSQRNPYEIREYSKNGNLRKVIFRKNKFMSPDRIEVLGENSFRSKFPSVSSLIAVSDSLLMNCVAVGKEIEYSYKTIVDFFRPNGQLYFSMGLRNRIAFLSFHNEKLYGLEVVPSTGEYAVVVYSLRRSNQARP